MRSIGYIEGSHNSIYSSSIETFDTISIDQVSSTTLVRKFNDHFDINFNTKNVLTFTAGAVSYFYMIPGTRYLIRSSNVVTADIFFFR